MIIDIDTTELAEIRTVLEQHVILLQSLKESGSIEQGEEHVDEMVSMCEEYEYLLDGWIAEGVVEEKQGSTEH